MRTKLIISALILCFVAIFTAFQIDDDPINLLLKRLEEYTNKNPQEKVHLHLDKPYYAVGDDIWFKAYVIDTRNSHPSEVSGSLYVELINENNVTEKQLKLPLMSGITWGDFKLTDSLSEGNYRIRAYTQLMRNAGPEYFFDKTIKIGNSWANKVFVNTTYTFAKENGAEKVVSLIKFTDKKGLKYAGSAVSYEVVFNSKNIAKGKATTNGNGEINFSFVNPQPNIYSSGKIIATITLPTKQKIVKNIPIKATSGTMDVQFFPEGGNLVESLPSKIGVKAVNSFGLGENVSGTVMDNEGAEIAKFSTTYLGMGNFILNPQPGKTYTAQLKFADGSEQKIALPKVLPSGYVISVNSADTSKITVKILLSPNVLGKGELRLIAQSSGNVCFVSKAKTERQVVTATIPIKNLPQGIVQFIIFSPNNTPVAERLVFIKHPENNIDLKVQSDKSTYARREKVDLSLNSTIGGQPTQGSFSVSVTNSAVVTPDPDNESNIFTSFLLTSDLAGYVEKPNHYFLQNNLETRQDLDNLMLTQGWRRFLWKDLLANTLPVAKFEVEKGLKISGTITTTGGKPIPLGKVSLFSSSGGLFMIDTLTDVNGHFVFDNIAFNDSTKFVVQARTAKNKKFVEIKLDAVAGQVVTQNKNSGDIEVNVNEALASYIRKSESYFDELTKRGLLERTVQLEEVNIVEKKNPAPNSANLNGAGNADYIVTADQLGTCATLSQCLQGRVAGLMIQNGTAYLMRNMGMSGPQPMLIVLDGVNVEADFLDNITPQDVETIEVLKSIGNTAIYGSRGGGGVLVITTKRGGGNYSANTYAPGIITYSPKGYYSVRQFYSPKYSPNTVDNRTDLRTTVYWNPHMVTDAAGKIQFSYFNTDLPGTYRVVVEGINGMGEIARNVYTYEVN